VRLISPALFKHQSVACDELKAARQQRGRWVVCGLIVAPGDDLNRPYTFAAIATSWCPSCRAINSKGAPARRFRRSQRSVGGQPVGHVIPSIPTSCSSRGMLYSKALHALGT